MISGSHPAEERIKAAIEYVRNDAAHAEDCDYIVTLQQSFATRRRGPVSPCDCYLAKVLAILSD